jgi:hypothetical protein
MDILKPGGGDYRSRFKSFQTLEKERETLVEVILSYPFRQQHVSGSYFYVGNPGKFGGGLYSVRECNQRSNARGFDPQGGFGERARGSARVAGEGGDVA